MISFKSNLSVGELVEKWDEFTSPARFAGSDETMDLIFVSKRKGNNVRLVRRARSTREPFSCVFRGKIKENNNGSEIVGVFTKAWGDYCFVGLILGLLFFIRSSVIERGESLNIINAILVFAIIAATLLLINTRRSKSKYADFISRITGQENTNFLSKKEIREREGSKD